MTEEEIEDDEFDENDASIPTFTIDIETWLFDMDRPTPEAITRGKFEKRKPAMGCPSINLLDNIKKHYDKLPPVQQRRLYGAMRSQMLRFLISCEGISTIDGSLQTLWNEMETNELVAIRTWYTFSTVTMGPRKIGYDECSNRGCNKTETLEMNFRRCSICKIPNYCSKECQAEDWKARHKRVCKTAKENVETMKEAGKLMQMFSDLSMTGGFEDAMASAAQKGQTFGEMVADNKKNNQAVRNRRKQIRKEKKRTIGEKAPDGPDPEFFQETWHHCGVSY